MVARRGKGDSRSVFLGAVSPLRRQTLAVASTTVCCPPGPSGPRRARSPDLAFSAAAPITTPRRAKEAATMHRPQWGYPWWWNKMQGSTCTRRPWSPRARSQHRRDGRDPHLRHDDRPADGVGPAARQRRAGGPRPDRSARPPAREVAVVAPGKILTAKTQKAAKAQNVFCGFAAFSALAVKLCVL